MSSFKPTNNRFSSLNDDTNTFSAPNHTNRDKGTSNQSFRQPRENRDNRERYDTRRRSYNENRSFNTRATKPKEFNITEDSYPSLSTVIIEDNKNVVDKVPEMSDHLKK